MSKIDNKKIPIPYTLSPWSPCTEVFYECANCGQDFRLLSNKIKYCYNCGQIQDWSNSPTHCSENFRDEYQFIVSKYNGYNYEEIQNQLTLLLFDFYMGRKK